MVGGITMSGVNNGKFVIDPIVSKFGRHIHAFVKWLLRMLFLGYKYVIVTVKLSEVTPLDYINEFII